jgi:hypothetical protein
MGASNGLGRELGALGALAVVLACGLALAGAAPGKSSKVHLSLRGVGDAHFGMTFAQIRRAVGSRFRCTSGNPCRCARTTSRENVTFVFGADRRLSLVVADLTPDGAKAVTGRGLALGDTEDRMRQLYPAARSISGTARYKWTRKYRGYLFDFSNGPLSTIIAGYKSQLLNEEFCA